MEDKEAKSIIESLLFISGETVTLDTLRKITEIDKYNTERLVKDLIDEYALRNSGIIIVEVAGGYQMVTNPGSAPWVKKLLSTAVPKKLTQSSLETLAIIAYKQPIIKAEIEAIRGVNSDGVVKTLLERRVIKILGRKEAPGRPLMYGTTPEFLQYFGLKDLSELPTLKEFEEVDIPEPPENLPEGSAEQEFTETEPEDTEEAVERAEGSYQSQEGSAIQSDSEIEEKEASPEQEAVDQPAEEEVKSQDG